MLKINNLNKRFKDFSLSDINLSIPKGYICGLIGENGAGKTTLMHLITGLYSIDSGEIFINGNNIDTDQITTKNDIGYVFNEELFDSTLSLVKNADSYGKYYSNYDKDTFISYCNRFNLDINKKLGKHSKGEKLKFQFAFALSHFPKLLLLDEPTANFDPEFRKEFIKILTEFIKDGDKSILIATHLTSDLERIADYVTFIHKGNIIFSYDIETLENSYRLVSGEDYKINLISPNKIINKEKGDYTTKALVNHRPSYKYDKDLSVDIPTLEDIMYFYIRSETSRF